MSRDACEITESCASVTFASHLVPLFCPMNLLLTGSHVRRFSATDAKIKALTFEVSRKKLPASLKMLAKQSWARVRPESVTIELQFSPDGSTLAERSRHEWWRETSGYEQMNAEVEDSASPNGGAQTIWRTIYAGPVVMHRGASPGQSSNLRFIIPVVRKELMPAAGAPLSLEGLAVIIDAAMEVCGDPADGFA